MRDVCGVSTVSENVAEDEVGDAATCQITSRSTGVELTERS